LAKTVSLAYVDQERDTLDPDKTIWEVISGGNDLVELGDRKVNSRAYVGRFNFSGADQQKKVSMISGASAIAPPCLHPKRGRQRVAP